MIELSLNEVETTTLKAARGAGLSWGEAEDAALATRWLARHGADWSALLEADLSDGGTGLRAALRLADAVSHAQGAWCTAPEATGAPWQFATLAALTQACDAAIEIAVPGDLAGVLWLHAGRLWGAEALPLGDLRISARLQHAVLPTAGCQALPFAAERPRIPEDRLQRLNELVERTYVPTSDRSRLRGAVARPEQRRDRIGSQ